MLVRLLSVTLVLLFKIVLYLSITCLCIQLSIVYSYQPAWLVCIRYIQCSVYTLQVYPVLGIYHIDISSARYIPYRYIQCSVCTLQVYPVLGTYPTDISRAWYIPYRYIQCSVYTLQVYPVLGIYPTGITLKKKSSTDPQIKSVHIGYEDQAFQCLYVRSKLVNPWTDLPQILIRELSKPSKILSLSLLQSYPQRMRFNDDLKKYDDFKVNKKVFCFQ